MTSRQLNFINETLEKYRTGYCDKEQNCSCESCEENFTVQQAQRYIENEIDMIIEEKQWTNNK